MGLESATYVSDLSASNPGSGDAVKQGDDHLRLIKSVLQSTFPNGSKAFRFPTGVAKSADYVVLSSDINKFFTVDATAAGVALTLPTLTTADDGWSIWVLKKDSTANAVTITGTVNGATNKVLSSQYQATLVWWSGTAWYALSFLVSGSVALTDLLIAAGTALTGPAVDDSVIIYDLSATANKKIALSALWAVINVLSAETAPDVADVMAMYDTSEGAANSMTFQNFLKVVNTLTEDTSPDLSNDYLLSYDASATAAKKVKPSNIGATRIAKAVARFKINFYATGSITAINAASDFVSTGPAHGITTGDLGMINGNTPTGMTTDAVYYMNALSSTTVAFYTTYANALADTGRVNITGGTIGGNIRPISITLNTSSGLAATAPLQFNCAVKTMTGTLTLLSAMSSANWSFMWQWNSDNIGITIPPSQPQGISQSTTVLTFGDGGSSTWPNAYSAGNSLYLEFAAWDG